MAKLIAVTACPTGIAHTIMAAEALKKTAPIMGHSITVETQGSEGVKNALSDRDIAAADAVILAADIQVNTERFSGKPIYTTSTSKAIRDTQEVLEQTAALIEPAAVAAPAPRAAREQPSQPSVEAAPTTSPRSQPAASGEAKYLIGVTSCPTGIAHTFMAAEALRKGASALGYDIKVETQGSVGAKNVLTDEDIARADAVVIAADTHVDTSRFAGKPIYQTSTKEALHDGKAVINSALAQPQSSAAPGRGNYAQSVQQAKQERSTQRTGPYKHLMTGVSYMLPVIVAGGLLIALAFAVGGIYAGEQEGTLAAALMSIGGAAFSLYVAVLSAFIAYSIADRPGIAPGLIGGLLAQTLGAGFLGGMVSGFLAGYVTKFLAEKIQLPQNLEGIKPVLLLPLLATGIVGLLMVYVVGAPVEAALLALTGWLSSLGTTNAVLLGLILGAMMAFDMGGPVNKAAYTFSVGLLGSQIYTPMAAVMAAGMTPPLGLALATFLFKDRFSADEQEAGKAAAVLGLSFVTEGAIPFAAKDPLRVIPSLMIGSAVAGAISMAAGSGLVVPHGGVFVLFIPNAVSNLLPYVIAILVGTLLTTAAIFFLKPRQVEEPVRAPVERTSVVAS